MPSCLFYLFSVSVSWWSPSRGPILIGGHEICQVWHEVTEKGPEKLSSAQERAPGVVVWFEEVGRASAAAEVYSGGGP